MTVSYWQDASGERTVEYDICVVGAGLVGLYLARLLTGACQRVCVLEARHEDGIPAQFTHTDPMKRGFIAAIVQHEDAGIHPVKFAQGLAASSGADLYEQSEVFAIDDLPGGGLEIKSRAVTVRCRVAAL